MNSHPLHPQSFWGKHRLLARLVSPFVVFVYQWCEQCSAYYLVDGVTRKTRADRRELALHRADLRAKKREKECP